MRFRLRNMSLMNATTNAGRSLLQSVMAPQVQYALGKWIKQAHRGLLIGGLALSYYVKPRYTADIDLLFRCEEEVPDEVRGFERRDVHTFQEWRHRVEVKVMTAAMLKPQVPEAVILKLFETAVESSGLSIVSKEGLAALKLYGERMQDRADIVALLRSYPTLDLAGWPLAEARSALLAELREVAAKENEEQRAIDERALALMPGWNSSSKTHEEDSH